MGTVRMSVIYTVQDDGGRSQLLIVGRSEPGAGESLRAKIGVVWCSGGFNLVHAFFPGPQESLKGSKRLKLAVGTVAASRTQRTGERRSSTDEEVRLQRSARSNRGHQVVDPTHQR